jgi:hypothetical protein
MWVTVVTPLPATSDPDWLTLANRFVLAASAGAALARPEVADAVIAAQATPVLNASRLSRRIRLVSVNMCASRKDMFWRLPSAGAAGAAGEPAVLTCQDWSKRAGQRISSSAYSGLRKMTRQARQAALTGLFDYYATACAHSSPGVR